MSGGTPPSPVPGLGRGETWWGSQGNKAALTLGYVAHAPDSVHGVLTKWVNLGKGFRQRYFVLQNGVLAYYKVRCDVHGNPSLRVTPASG